MSDALEQGEVHLDVLSDKEIAYTVRQDESPQTYIREDVVRGQIEAAVKRALEGAGEACETIRQRQLMGPMPEKACFDQEQAIRALDPAQFLDGDK